MSSPRNSEIGPPGDEGHPWISLPSQACTDLTTWHTSRLGGLLSDSEMRVRGLTALVLVVYLFGSTGLTAVGAAGNDVAAIQHTLSSASDNAQIADTNSQTTNSGAAAAPAETSLQQQPVPASQSTVPANPQAAQINNALLQTTNLATQIVQAAPPASSYASTS